MYSNIFFVVYILSATGISQIWISPKKIFGNQMLLDKIIMNTLTNIAF